MQEEVVCLQVDNIKNAEQALAYLGNQLVATGAVKDSYVKAVIDREAIFPTGLQFEDYGVAIPHTDSEHVNHTQLALMTLTEPVSFTQMATNDQPVSVRLIIMLAIKDSHEQVDMLQKLITLLQNPDVVHDLLAYGPDCNILLT